MGVALPPPPRRGPGWGWRSLPLPGGGSGWGSDSSRSATTYTLTFPCPTRSAASSASTTRVRSAFDMRKRSCTTSRTSPRCEWMRVYPCCSRSWRTSVCGKVLRHAHREGDEQARVAGRLAAALHLREDSIGRVAPHRRAAAAAEQLGGAREQELHVVVELRHRADGRARGAHRVGLVDSDGGRDAVDAIDCRLVHPIEELPGVGRESLHVTTLALGVQRVEHQRGLARAGHAGDHHQLVERNGNVEILQIVLAGAMDVMAPCGASCASRGFMRMEIEIREAPQASPAGQVTAIVCAARQRDYREPTLAPKAVF